MNNYYVDYDKIANQYKKYANSNIAEWDTNYRGYGTGIGGVDTSKMNRDQIALYENDKNVVDRYREAALNMEKQKKDLGVQADNQRQNAYVQSELTKKYLPQQQKASGTYGLGTSETASLNIANQYRNTVNGINNSYTKRNNQLDDNFYSLTNTLNLQSDAATAEYNKIVEGYRQAAAYNAFNDQLNKADTDLTKYKSELDNLSHALTPEQYANLNSAYGNRQSEQIYNEMAAKLNLSGLDLDVFANELNSLRGNLRPEHYQDLDIMRQNKVLDKTRETAKNYISNYINENKAIYDGKYGYDELVKFDNYLKQFGQKLREEDYNALYNEFASLAENENEFNTAYTVINNTKNINRVRLKDRTGTTYKILNQPLNPHNEGLGNKNLKTGQIYTNENGEKYIYHKQKAFDIETYVLRKLQKI